LRARALALAAIALTLSSCGGSGGAGTAPVISNLTFSPAGAYQNSGSGTAAVSGSISFNAPAGNVASISITVISPGGQNLGTTSVAAPGAAGRTSGLLGIQGSASTAALGSFTFRVAVIDSSGHSSNTLTGMFTIAVSPWQAQATGPKLTGASAVVVNTLVYEFAVRSGVSVGWTYDPVANAWAQNGPIVPTPRASAALAVLGPSIYVIGGNFPGLPGSGMTVVEAYDVVASQWTSVAPLQSGRGQGAAIVLNGLIYALGGWASGRALNSVETYDPTTNTWTLGTHTLASTSGTVSATVVNGVIYVTDANGHVDQYDPASGTWSNVLDLANGVGSAALGTDGTSLYAFGGLVNQLLNQPSAGVQFYDPASPQPIGTRASMPVAVGDPLAVAFASTLIVIDPDSGAALQYTPASDIF
jgi:hypothetical protein